MSDFIFFTISNPSLIGRIFAKINPAFFFFSPLFKRIYPSVAVIFVVLFLVIIVIINFLVLLPLDFLSPISYSSCFFSLFLFVLWFFLRLLLILLLLSLLSSSLSLSLFSPLLEGFNLLRHFLSLFLKAFAFL